MDTVTIRLSEYLKIIEENNVFKASLNDPKENAIFINNGFKTEIITNDDAVKRITNRYNDLLKKAEEDNQTKTRLEYESYKEEMRKGFLKQKSLFGVIKWWLKNQ